MPLDPSIILQAGKGVTPLMTQADIQDTQMKALQLQQARQGLADDQTYRQTLMSTPTDQLVGALQKAGLGKQAMAAQQFQTQQQQAAGERGKVVAQGLKDGAAAILANPTEDNAIATLNQAAQQYQLPQSMVDTAKARIYAAKGDPMALKQLAVGWGGDAEKVLGKFTNTDTGGSIVPTQINPLSGQVNMGAPITKTASPDAQLSSQTSTNNSIRSTNQSAANNAATNAKDFAVAGLNADGSPKGNVEDMAQGIASGKLPPISGYALSRPGAQAVMARVMEINPSYDAGDYAAKNQALKSFSTGKEGAQARSFNVATDHLDTLGQAVDALNNGNIQLFNRVGNAWNQQTGQAAPTDFNAVKDIVAKEVVKAIVQGGGGVSEREELAKLMDAANSPAQLKGVISHYKELMGAQMQGLQDQYKRTTGRDDFATQFAPSKPTGPQPKTKAVTIGGKDYMSELAPDGKYYVQQNGKWFEVR